MQGKKDWSSFKDILCVRPDNLGDVLMTSPAIRALKESVPGRRVTLLTSRAGKSIARFIPGIDRVITFDIPWYKHERCCSTDGIYRVIEEIKQYEFDAAVIFTVFSQNPLPTAMLCYLAGIPRIAGYCRENPYKLMSDWIPDKEPLFEMKHEVVRQLDLVKTLGAGTHRDTLSLTIADEAKKILERKLTGLGIKTSEPWIVIHPGVSEIKRQYPVESFSKVVKALTQELNVQVLLTGIASEQHLADEIMAGADGRAFSLMDKLNLEELIALIDRSTLLIANNTGPVHIAAAVNTPVLVLYAMTNPQHTPWKVPHHVLTFGVPEAMRSKNVIIEKANESAFPKNTEMVRPDAVIRAAKKLLFEKRLQNNGRVSGEFQGMNKQRTR